MIAAASPRDASPRRNVRQPSRSRSCSRCWLRRHAPRAERGAGRTVHRQLECCLTVSNQFFGSLQVGSSPRWATFRRFHVTRHNARSQALFATKIGPRSAPAMGLMGLLDKLASGACRRAAARSQCVMRAYSVQRACQMRAQRSIWRGSCCRPRVRCACGRATRAMRARCGS